MATEFELMITLLKQFLKRDVDLINLTEFIKSNSIDWDKFIDLCIMHRVETFIYNIAAGYNDCSLSTISNILNNLKTEKALPGFPEYVLQNLKKLSDGNVKKAYSLYSESLKIKKIFSENTIPFTILKGAMFSERYYGNIGLRHSGDIDTLISPSDTEKAISLLQQSGYTYNLKTPVKQQMKFKHHLSMKKNSIELELHWRPFIYNYLLNIDIKELNHRKDKMDETDIRKSNICHSLSNNYFGGDVLPFEEYFIYLCVHGSKHNWFRLFWLLDIAVIIQQEKIKYGELFNKAGKYGVIRPVAEALFLSNILFETKLPPIFTEQYLDNSIINYLVNNSMGCIFNGCNITESGMLFKKFSLFILRLKHNINLKKDIKFKLDVLKVHLTHSKDWEILQLPAPLFPLYFILRPVFFIIRNIRK